MERREGILAATFAAAVLGLAGCRTTAGVAGMAHDVPAGRTIAVVTEFPPDLMAFRTDHMYSQEVATQQAIAEGKQVARTSGLQDPALAISEALGQKLVALRGMTRVAADPAVVVSGSADTLVPFFPGVDYVLVVGTTWWSYSHYLFDWKRYHTNYKGRFRLIDTASKRVIAQGSCSSRQDNKPGRPDLPELLADDAAVLKEFFARAAEACTGTLAAKIQA